MNMMQMVSIMVACYFITLTLLCIYRDIINVKIANTVFIIVDLIFFLGWNYAAYQRGWLEDGFMTLENISPFIMTLIPLTVFMSEKVRSYCNSAIAFLWIGMFLALMISPQHAYIFSYHIEASFIYSTEAACHLLASLYGIYLIISGQVKCDSRHWVKSIVCMFSVIGFGVLLNYLFHIDNFGMDPYGDYTIYMIDIFGSFGATLIAYLLGVLVVLTLGMQFGSLLNRLVVAAHLPELPERSSDVFEDAEKEEDGNFALGGEKALAKDLKTNNSKEAKGE
nr:hypothetical protein [Oscillospiraceae bacterium]